MEGQRRALTLVVITLLQLCRAVIKDAQPQWYAANVINEGFQPKSISEIFSTEASFSTANPIIVSSKYIDDDIQLLSSLAPHTSLSSSTTFRSTTPVPPSSQFDQMSTFTPTQPPLFQSSLQEFQSSPSVFQSSPPVYQTSSPTFQSRTPIFQSNAPPVQQQSNPPAILDPMIKILSNLQIQPHRNVQIQQEQLTSSQTLPPNPPMTTFYQMPSSKITSPQDIRFETIPQTIQTSFGPESSTDRLPQNIPQQPNYILVYQQAPQSQQMFPVSSSSPETSQETFATTRAPPVTSTSSSTFSSPFSTFSTTSIPTSPLFVSTTRPPTTRDMLPTSPRVTVTSLSSIGTSRGSSTRSNSNINCAQLTTTPLPRLSDRPIQKNQMLPMKIRIMAPKGSITNVHFNPPTVKPRVYTTKYVVQKVTRMTTTRKPTTPRTPKPKKNTYERCLRGCRKGGQQLCAGPLSQYPVDPKALRGFPSVCHMACHNSYKKDAFEKITDGNCSKLRTRIRTVDSKSKLKKEELQKVQYFLDDDQQPTFEFTGTYS